MCCCSSKPAKRTGSGSLACTLSPQPTSLLVDCLIRSDICWIFNITSNIEFHFLCRVLDRLKTLLTKVVLVTCVVDYCSKPAKALY